MNLETIIALLSNNSFIRKNNALLNKWKHTEIYIILKENLHYPNFKSIKF